MNALKKINFSPFPWLNLEYLPDSQGQKFELNAQVNSSSAEFIAAISSIFQPYSSTFIIGHQGEPGIWGDFCIDTWDFKNNVQNFQIKGKSPETQRYLQFLEENGVEPEYFGCCICKSWDIFIPIVWECVKSHNAPYSPIFYNLEHEYMFYIHHSFSVGVYYLQLNNGILEILSRSAFEKMEITNSTDPRVAKIK
jgi:hypothetical protein